MVRIDQTDLVRITEMADTMSRLKEELGELVVNFEMLKKDKLSGITDLQDSLVHIKNEIISKYSLDPNKEWNINLETGEIK